MLAPIVLRYVDLKAQTNTRVNTQTRIVGQTWEGGRANSKTRAHAAIRKTDQTRCIEFGPIGFDVPNSEKRVPQDQKRPAQDQPPGMGSGQDQAVGASVLRINVPNGVRGGSSA